VTAVCLPSRTGRAAADAVGTATRSAVGRALSDAISEHPCYSEAAHHRWARLHLPVAPRCNISCAYCDRRVADCFHARRPGVTSRLLAPAQVGDLVRRTLEAEPRLRVVGVAGPGEPLANPETFEALAAAKDAHPGLTLCLSTNGLLLPDRVPALAALGVSTVTVTVNTVRPEVGRLIYLRVTVPDAPPEPAGPAAEHHTGPAAEDDHTAAVALLIDRQLEGIRRAAAAGLAVKVNTVLIPGVNDRCCAAVARAAAERGAVIHNIAPLIPLGALAGKRPPTCAELRQARTEAERYLPQFRLCKQCRADAVGVPGEEARGGA